MNRDEIEVLIRDLNSMALSRILTASPKMLNDTAAALLALLPALPPGEPTDDEVRDWAYNTLATDTDGDTRGVWWSTITPARKGMYRRAMLSARPSPPATLWEREPDTDEWRSQGHETQVISE